MLGLILTGCVTVTSASLCTRLYSLLGVLPTLRADSTA